MVHFKDRELPFKIRQTRKAFIHWYLLSLILIILGILLLFNVIKGFFAITSYLILMIGILNIVYFEVRRIVNSLIVDKHKLERSSGIFSTHETSAYYNKITDITVKKNLFGKMLNFGDLHINTSGTITHEIVFKSISHPGELRNFLESLKK